MAFAVVYDVAASWERYGPVSGAMSDPAPRGLVVLAAGPTDEGVRIISVWEEEDAWRRFLIERLAPAMSALEGPPPALPVERHFNVIDVALGDRFSHEIARRP